MNLVGGRAPSTCAIARPAVPFAGARATAGGGALVVLGALVTVFVLAVPPAGAQSEAHLKQFFEGKSVLLKIDMPATDDGVDVRPDHTPSLDRGKYTDRLRTSGTAIRIGEAIVITRVRVKKKLIEFQLGGGGHGFWKSAFAPDETVSKSDRQEALERRIKYETDPAEKKRLQSERDKMEEDRKQKETEAKKASATVKGLQLENEAKRALTMGSRFNLRWESSVPADALTPAAVARALSDYVEFPPESFDLPPAAEEADAAGTRGAAVTAADSTRGLRKGMTEAEVRAVLGAPATVTERTEGSLKIAVWGYKGTGGPSEVEFAEGIVFRYRLTPK